MVSHALPLDAANYLRQPPLTLSLTSTISTHNRELKLKTKKLKNYTSILKFIVIPPASLHCSHNNTNSHKHPALPMYTSSPSHTSKIRDQLLSWVQLALHASKRNTLQAHKTISQFLQTNTRHLNDLHKDQFYFNKERKKNCKKITSH